MTSGTIALDTPAPASRYNELAIWTFAFGYFACYVPYAALTKALTDGLGPLATHVVSGTVLLPATAVASTLAALAFLTAMRWWRFAHHVSVGALRLPRPTRWTFLSGLGSATVIVTTTLAYSFRGISVVFMVLLMKGGVLVIAPIVDALSRRSVRWFSWLGLALSLATLALTFTDADTRLTTAATLDVVAYLGAYFVRLSLMSHHAKSTDGEARLRFFVEEHMVASPALLAILAVLALAGVPELRAGFGLLGQPGVLIPGVGVGLLSEGTGIFGGLVLLDPRENTFAVPVNRASSILAGVVGSLALAAMFGSPLPPARELLGAGLVLLAIVVLATPSLLGHAHLSRGR